MILIYLDIVLIKLLGDVSQIMKLEVSCLFAMIKPMEGTLMKNYCGQYTSVWILLAHFVQRCP